MPRARSLRALAGTGDDRYLAEMTRCVFQAGFVWRVVDHKWDDFEDVFFGFHRENRAAQPRPDRSLQPEPRIISQSPEGAEVQHNARFILEVAREHGSSASSSVAGPRPT